jgi:hypothetical protein
MRLDASSSSTFQPAISPGLVRITESRLSRAQRTSRRDLALAAREIAIGRPRSVKGRDQSSRVAVVDSDGLE